MKKNYDFTNEYVNTKLLKIYRERNNKEFICKKCHDNLKYGQQNQSNEVQNKMMTMCICCDNIIILQHNTLEFDQVKYKLKGKFLEILENRQIDVAMKKYICNSCDILLRNGHFPVNILQSSSTCFFCKQVPSKVIHIYDQNVYGNNAFSKQFEANNITVDKGSVICEKCHK